MENNDYEFFDRVDIQFILEIVQEYIQHTQDADQNLSNDPVLLEAIYSRFKDFRKRQVA